MSAPVPFHPPDIQVTRTGLLAAVSVVVATCSVAVTLAVTGLTPPAAPSVEPETAKPDAATLYHHGAMERRR
jgi:hypothetical protein